jgi:hypothetical protein
MMDDITKLEKKMRIKSKILDKELEFSKKQHDTKDKPEQKKVD